MSKNRFHHFYFISFFLLFYIQTSWCLLYCHQNVWVSVTQMVKKNNRAVSWAKKTNKKNPSTCHMSDPEKRTSIKKFIKKAHFFPADQRNIVTFLWLCRVLKVHRMARVFDDIYIKININTFLLWCKKVLFFCGFADICGVQTPLQKTNVP